MRSPSPNYEVNVFKSGRGAPLLLVHGGPGFDHNYLQKSMAFLANDFEIISYDQIGCGIRMAPAGVVTLDDLAAEFLDVVRQIRTEKGLRVIAHSWGSLVIAAATTHRDWQSIMGNGVTGTFINPLPLDHRAFKLSYQRFLRRIPILKKLYIVLMGGMLQNERRIVDGLWPFYFGPGKVPSNGKPALSLPTYRASIKGLGEYDLRSAVTALENFSVLRGEYDATTPEMLGEWIGRSRNFETINGAGHFPMLEYPRAWQTAIVDAIG